MPEENKGFVASLLAAVLGFVDKPWKAVFVIILAILLGGGFLIRERPELLQPLVDRYRPLHLRSDADLGGTIDYFFAGFNVDAVAVWHVDLASSYMTLRVARLRDGTPWRIGPSPTQFAGTDKDKRITGLLLRGEPGCADPRTLPSALAQSMVASGMIYICYVPEPPSHLHTTQAIVMLGWRATPAEPLVDAAIAVVEQSTKHILH